MIHLLVPPQQSGGVYDFGCKLQASIGQDNARVIYLSKDTAAEWRIGPNDTVLLQLSGYGFNKRGVPLWLLHEIEKRRTHMKSFGVFFHELYAFGPPWSSSFWLSPVQRHIARRLAELSDFWMTNRDGSARWLERFAGAKPHAVLPVFSTIGEPAGEPQARLPNVVVFGSPGLRQATYQAAGAKLFAWARRASLQILDIGAPVADRRLADTLRANGVVLHGRLSAEAARALMADAVYGLLAYPVDYVAKSSVFAAYCAHGVCPVLLSQAYGAADGLVGERHYLPGVPDHDVDAENVAAIGEAAFVWYQPHRLQQHVDAIRGFLGDWEGC